MIGESILHYKILEKLGEGGMGVVYKAQDTKLNRIVALKFLPDKVNQDAEAKKRFLQEAQAVAALNHSNICTIYGIEESDASLFMVMEYVDGGTLTGKIPFSKINDALKTAVEIGEALQEAHSKGIVHRDIKADNIMLTSKGQVRVMDFGLAKLKGALRLTKSLSTVGTLGYMSPEQIQGGEIDNRSDIFSFGVLLFEMLTGKLPFGGQHEAAIIYSVVNEEPQDIAALVPDLSPLVVHLIQRCLEKDPDDRYQSMKDAVSDLRRAMKKSSGSMARSTITRKVDVPRASEIHSAEQPVSNLSKKSFLQSKYIIGLAGIVVIAIAAYLFLHKGTPELNPDMTSRTIQMPLTEFQYPGLSPDGNWIAFPAADANNKWDIYWMHSTGGEARRVTFDSSASPGRNLHASISPDGGLIAYNRFNPKDGPFELCVVSSNGGTGREIAKGVIVSAEWTPEGKRISYMTLYNNKYYSLHSIGPDGTGDRLEYVDSIGTSQGNFSYAWSPDGKSIAWIRDFQGGYQEIIIHNLKTGNEKQLTSDKKNIDEVCWTTNNMIIFSSNKAGNTNLWCIPAGGGKEQQITRGSGPDLGVVVSADCKKLLYYQNQDLGYIWRANGSGTDQHQITFENQYINDIAFSPDGRYIAYTANEANGFRVDLHLFGMKSDGSDKQQLTFGNESAHIPSFSPDGKHISYSTLVNDTLKIKVIDFPNPGSPKILHTGIVTGWIDENNMIVFDGNSNKSWKVPLNGSPATQVGEDSTVALHIENGKYIFYQDRKKGREGYSIKTEGSRSKLLLTFNNAKHIYLSASQFFYYQSRDGSVWKMHLPDGRKEKLQVTFPGLTGRFSLSTSKDGKSIVFINHQSRGRLVMIDNLFK